jgi:hypothetical protein
MNGRATAPASAQGANASVRVRAGLHPVEPFRRLWLRAHDDALSTSFATASAAALCASASMCV